MPAGLQRQRMFKSRSGGRQQGHNGGVSRAIGRESCTGWQIWRSTRCANGGVLMGAPMVWYQIFKQKVWWSNALMTNFRRCCCYYCRCCCCRFCCCRVVRVVVLVVVVAAKGWWQYPNINLSVGRHPCRKRKVPDKEQGPL